MKLYLFILLSVGMYAYAELPSPVKDNATRDNIEYIDQKLNYYSANVHFPIKTLAQLQQIKPDKEGEAYYCSTCSPKKVVVSVGTSVGDFLAIDGSAFN